MWAVVKCVHRIGFIPVLWVAVSCVQDAGNPGTTGPGTRVPYGGFQVSLKSFEDGSGNFTSVLGRLYSGPSPSPLIWEERAKEGTCRLLVPRAPFCENPCGSAAACVEDGKCQDYPEILEAGTIVVKGIKTKSGTAAFSMNPIAKTYQPTGGVALEYPPFAEGDAVSFSAGGDTAVSGFSLTATGIKPLVVLSDSLTLTDGISLLLAWSPPTRMGASTISVLVDISHHGGTKGKIECETQDNGSLEIAAALVDKLKALGVSGFPKLDLARQAWSANPGAKARLLLESRITKSLSIPGMISCNTGKDCPEGQACQPDLKCK